MSGGEEDTDIYPPSGRSIKIKRLVAGLKSGIQWRSWDWVSTDWNQGRGRLICKWKGVATTHCRARFLSFEALVTGERCGSAPREYSPWTLPPPCCSNGNEFWWNNFGESLEKFGRRWYEVGGRVLETKVVVVFREWNVRVSDRLRYISERKINISCRLIMNGSIEKFDRV